MVAYFTAIVRAPLTGIVLILEMIGNYTWRQSKQVEQGKLRTLQMPSKA